eukprot:gene3774-22115_t
MSLLTEADFVSHYGGTSEWDAAPARCPIEEGSDEWAAVCELFLKTINGDKIPTRGGRGTAASHRGPRAPAAKIDGPRRRRTVVAGVDRLQIPNAYAAVWASLGGCGAPGEQLFMFHGCRSLASEAGIISRGFVMPSNHAHKKAY